MSEPLVVFDNVVKRYGQVSAVRQLNLQIQQGEFVAIMGPSGCGKTTTLRMLAGLEQPSEGEIRLGGRRMNELPAWQRETPMVWQSLALFPFLNVRENVEFGLKMRGIGAGARSQRALHWLERMEIAEFAERNITQLSGGQRQRVALARALVTEPEILLLDEPLSALDANLVVRMQNVLMRLQKDLAITFVYVTHSQSEAFAMADRVVIMNQGRIEQVGPPEQVYRTPACRFVAEFVGTNNILSGTIETVNESVADGISINTAQGRFIASVDANYSFRQGDRANLVISADRIDISSQPLADYPNQLSCHLISEQFIGSMIMLYLETADGTELRVQKPHNDLQDLQLRPGKPLTIGWPANAALLLTEHRTGNTSAK